MPFALTNTKVHSFTIDILEKKSQGFGDAQPRTVHGHEDRPVLQVLNRLEEGRKLFGAQHVRELPLASRIRNMIDDRVPTEGDLVEKTKRAYGLIEKRPGRLLLLDKIELV